MTTVTNIKDLPGPLVEAIRNDPYSRGEADISVTGLLSPPRQQALLDQFNAHVVEDASDRIWSLLGKSVHYVLEQSAECGISEERMYLEVDGWTVSGQFDHLSLRDADGVLILTDWKVTSVWTLIYGDRVDEWAKQLNTYALLLRQHGYEVDEMQVVAILRDWQVRQARLDPDSYPPAAAARVELQLWSEEEQWDFLRERVALHQAARVDLPKCTPEERWAKPDSYALYGYTKKGERKTRATRVFNSMEQALDYKKEHSEEPLDIEERQGDQWVRCRDYCPVAQFCTQFQEGAA